MALNEGTKEELEPFRKIRRKMMKESLEIDVDRMEAARGPVTSEVLKNYLYGYKEMRLISADQLLRNVRNQKQCQSPNSPPPCGSPRKLRVPEEISLCSSSLPGATYGACASQKIAHGTWFGPFEGRLVRTTDTMHNTEFLWEIFHDGEVSHYLDGSEENNWMTFVQCARHKKEQNMVVFQYHGCIYYRATKDIPAGFELLVWYDNKYTQLLGLPLAWNDTRASASKRKGGLNSSDPPKKKRSRNSESKSPLSDKSSSSDTRPSLSSTPSPTERPSVEKRPSLPEIRPVLPEVRPVLPEIRPMLPEIRPKLPEIRPLLPEVRPLLSEPRPMMPESRPMLPESRPMLPESRPMLPESRPMLSEPRPMLPESRPMLTEAHAAVLARLPPVNVLSSAMPPPPRDAMSRDPAMSRDISREPMKCEKCLFSFLTREQLVGHKCIANAWEANLLHPNVRPPYKDHTALLFHATGRLQAHAAAVGGGVGGYLYPSPPMDPLKHFQVGPHRGPIAIKQF